MPASTISYFSRVAFITNACFVLVWFLRYLPSWAYKDANSLITTLAAVAVSGISSMILIIGLVLSFMINPLVNIWYAGILISRKPFRERVPVWLAVINFLFLVIQLYLVLK